MHLYNQDTLNHIGLTLMCRGEATCCSAPVRPAERHSHRQVPSAAPFINMHVRLICLAISNNGGFTGALTLQRWYKSHGYGAGWRTARGRSGWSANVFHRWSQSHFLKANFFLMNQKMYTYHYLKIQNISTSIFFLSLIVSRWSFDIHLAVWNHEKNIVKLLSSAATSIERIMLKIWCADRYGKYDSTAGNGPAWLHKWAWIDSFFSLDVD